MRQVAPIAVEVDRNPLVVIDAELKVEMANAAFLDLLGVDKQDTAGPLLDQPNPSFPVPALIEMIAPRPASGEQTNCIASEPEPPAGVWQTEIRRFRQPSSGKPMVLLSLREFAAQPSILQQQLEMLLESLPGAFLAVDGQRRIRFINAEALLLFGYTAAEIVGQPMDVLVPQALREQHIELHAEFVANPVKRRMGQGMATSAVARNGAIIPVDIGLSPVTTFGESLVIAAIRDLREQKRGEEQLRQAKAVAERANWARSRCVAAASHDLRQPLQTIGLLLGLLERRVADRESRSTLEQLDDAVARMTELLDNLLDVNRLESEQFAPEITDFSIAPVLSRLYEELRPVAAAKGLQLRVVLNSSLVRSDRRLLARMIGNLLANAVKYTSEGKVLVGCRHQGGALRIEVWDNGIGLAADQLEAVFDEFCKVDGPATAQSQLGLGVYIVQHFARLLGHKVEVRSIPGGGTVFALVVSLAERQRKLTFFDQPNSHQTPQPSILLVEDDLRQREALSSLLELEGYRVIAAATPSEALAQIVPRSNLRPDVIIADYSLPGSMTGLDTIRNARHAMGEQCPAIAITADKSSDTRRAVEASGAILVSKPVRAAELISIVDDLVRTVRPGRRRSPSSKMVPMLVAEAVSKALIAVIDDNVGVLDAFRQSLAADGYEVAAFESGEAFITHTDRGRFRCLVVDLNLPGMDGLELLSRLKQESANVPVIFVTGSGNLSLVVRAMREGAADVLQKPIRAETLLETVNRALESSEKLANHLGQRDEVATRIAMLTVRERQVMERIAAGELTKNIAADLKISERTAEHYRHGVMRKIGARSLAMLVRLVAPHLTETQSDAKLAKANFGKG